MSTGGITQRGNGGSSISMCPACSLLGLPGGSKEACQVDQRGRGKVGEHVSLGKARQGSYPCAHFTLHHATAPPTLF